MQKYSNSVTNRAGDAIKNAQVTVTTNPGGAAAVLYSDNGVTPVSQPLFTDTNGYFEFYAADGRYNISITKAGIEPITISDALIVDAIDAIEVAIAGIGGGDVPTSTDGLPEGATNKYFTEARVRATALTGLSTASAAAITSADSVLSALGKAQAQINAVPSSITSGLKPRAVVQLIHDTDIGDDCDDIGAFAVMHRLADLGECEILACGYAPNDLTGPVNISVMNTYYGRGNIPIGVSKAGGYNGGPGHDNYRTYLSTGWPAEQSTSTNFEEAYKLYRRILASQPDVADSPSGGVTFMTQGQLTNLYALYNSVADDYSPLNGEDLMLAKCKEVVILGGTYPSGSEFDFTTDATSAQVINQLHASLPVIWSGDGYGGDVFTNSVAATYGPVRAGYDEFFRVYGGTTRQSWGAMCVMYAVRGLSFGGDTYATLSGQGANAVNGAGANTFTLGTTKNQYYLIRSLAAATFASRIQALQDALPLNISPRYMPAPIQVACSDRSTALSIATNVASFTMPFAGTLAEVIAEVDTVSSSGLVTVDVNKGGTTVLPTKCSIDASEKSSLTAATPAVIAGIATRTFAKGDLVSIDIDAAGTGAKGLVVTLNFWRNQ